MRAGFLRAHGLRAIGLMGTTALAAAVLFYAAGELRPWKTRDYVRRFEPSRYVRQGTDFGNPDYTLEASARRAGVSPQRLDRVYDYDFFKLIAAQQRLAGIDRAAALRGLFEKLTAGAGNNTQKHLRVLKFLHQASLHNAYLQPTHPDRAMVTDPLLLLELGEMRCGHVARLAVDLFAAGGYRGRLVPLASHVIAEIEYDGAWHYLDADLFGNGDTLLDPDGSIPSVEHISRTPSRIDSLPASWEPPIANIFSGTSFRRPSYYYFSRQAWNASFAGNSGGMKPPHVLVKKATPAQERCSRSYGWERLSIEPAPRQLDDSPPSFAPGAPQWESIDVRSGQEGGLPVVRAALSWKPSADADGDLVGYRVMVSRRSRGWNYDSGSLPDHLMPFKSLSARWRPGMYDARFTLPNSEIALIETPAAAASLALAVPCDYYITVMPYDAHGEHVGQKLYPMSEEIRIRAATRDDGPAKPGT